MKLKLTENQTYDLLHIGVTYVKRNGYTLRVTMNDNTEEDTESLCVVKVVESPYTAIHFNIKP